MVGLVAYQIRISLARYVLNYVLLVFPNKYKVIHRKTQ